MHMFVHFLAFSCIFLHFWHFLYFCIFLDFLACSFVFVRVRSCSFVVVRCRSLSFLVVPCRSLSFLVFHFLSLFVPFFFHFLFSSCFPFFSRVLKIFFICIDCLTISYLKLLCKKSIFWAISGGSPLGPLFFSLVSCFFIFVLFFNFFPCFSFFFFFSFSFFPSFSFCSPVTEMFLLFSFCFSFFFSRVLKICGDTQGFLGEKSTF